MTIKSKICWCCAGDRHHPMAPHPRTGDTVAKNPCPVCEGWGVIVETLEDSESPTEKENHDA